MSWIIIASWGREYSCFSQSLSLLLESAATSPLKRSSHCSCNGEQCGDCIAFRLDSTVSQSQCSRASAIKHQEAIIKEASRPWFKTCFVSPLLAIGDMLAPLEGSLSPSSFAKASSHLPTQYTVSCSAASSRSPNNSHLLSISPTRADPGRFIAIKQVDFDPQPSPSTYRIQSGKDCRFSSRSHSQSSNCRVKDCSPSTGSSAFFFLSDPDLLRVSIDSGSELRNSRSRPFGSLVYHWSEQRGDMSSLDQQSSEHRRYTKDTLWEDTNAQSNEEIRYALVEAFRDLQAISLDCHGDCFETQRRWYVGAILGADRQRLEC